MALTPKQQRFAEEYPVDLNATQAAIRAGYSPRSAGQQGEALLKKHEIQKAVQEAMNQRSERTQVTADYVLRTIVDTVERCKQEIRPVLTQRGEQVYGEDPETGAAAPLYQFDAKNVLKGAELLGKHLALFTEKHEHSSPDGSMTPKTIVSTDPVEAAKEYQKIMGGDG